MRPDESTLGQIRQAGHFAMTRIRTISFVAYLCSSVHLAKNQVPKRSFDLDKVVVGAALHELPVFQYVDLIRIANGG